MNLDKTINIIQINDQDCAADSTLDQRVKQALTAMRIKHLSDSEPSNDQVKTLEKHHIDQKV